MFSAAPAPVRAQDESELATTTQNPVADLILVPLQNNANFGVGHKAAIPFRLTDECNPGVVEGAGFGDMQLSRVPLPTALALTVQGPGAVGALVNYDLPSDCHINSVPIITADWKADADARWTLPIDATLLNRRMDKYALKPIAMGWKTAVPQPAGIMIANAFDNITVVPRVINNLLQGKWHGAGREVSRFLINSTVGVGGLHDPAKDVWHITKSPADFGQTLGKWGIRPGPYLVLPFMEPLTVRDGIGKVIDRTIDPLTYLVPVIPALTLMAGNRVNERALNYELFAAFDDDVIDAYAAVRNGYLRRREGRVNE
jgi:ABC-type transporter lipoprotein component MlaA